MRGKRPARHAAPRAFYDCDLSANWEQANRAAGLLAAAEKHCERAGRIVAELITRLKAELVLEREVRERLKGLDCSAADAIELLTEEVAVNEHLWRRLMKGLMRANINRRSTETSGITPAWELEGDRVYDAIKRRSVRGLLASPRAREVVVCALEISLEALPRGNVPSILEPTLVELGFVFLDAGGEVTKGADGKSTKFDRWALALIEEAVGRPTCTLAEIVNITRNLDWKGRQPRQAFL